MKTARVLVRCVKCRSERWVGPGEIPEGDIPLCPECSMPQVAVKAEARDEPHCLAGPGDEVTDKAAYVKSQRQTRDHVCHWPSCDRQVPPDMWGCRIHWYALPKSLRDRIWATYEPGQEVSLTPSAEYLAVAHEAQIWIAAHMAHSTQLDEGEKGAQ